MRKKKIEKKEKEEDEKITRSSDVPSGGQVMAK